MSTLRRLLSVALVLSATACTTTSTSTHRDPSSFGGFGPASGPSPEIGSAASADEPFHVEPVHVAHGDIHESSAMRFASHCSHCP